MARQPRLAVSGELHHVLLRGHNGQPVFADDVDRAAFVDVLREPAARLGVAIHAYALLTAEVHLLVTPTEADSLGRLMQSIGRSYGLRFNRRHSRHGALWDGRFRTSLLDAATLLLPATLHIESLPVRAGVAASAPEWTWSSAAHHTGQRRDPLLTDHALYWRLGNTPFDREHAHTLALTEHQQGKCDARFDLAVLQARALGPAPFVARVGEQLGRSFQPRALGRPVRSHPKKTVPT